MPAGALQKYLLHDLQKAQRRLPAALADESAHVFRTALESLTGPCEEFLSNGLKQVSYLLLGKIQSGKTAHLLGSLAWAADMPIAAAVVYTGITHSLNEQTQQRLRAELSALDGRPIEVLEIPTLSKKAKFREFRERFLALAAQRSSRDGSPGPMPVIVTLKNHHRARAVNSVLADLAQLTGPASVVLAIDDEADQASQNARSYRRSEATTYAEMRKLRELPTRNIWLSYTATPQAVLLTDRMGALRPDFLSVVPPRTSYFGLTDAMSDEFSANRVLVDDWPGAARNVLTCPASLTHAIQRFFLIALLRDRHPRVFYSRAEFAVDPGSRLSSTQMLIHESGFRVDHERMQRLVINERNNLAAELEELLTGSLNAAEAERVVRSWQEVAHAIAKGNAQSGVLDSEVAGADALAQLLQIIKSVQIAVINSDPVVGTAVKDRPVSDSDYEAHIAWILIGGDILGRGLTIPQLTVSYFLRGSAKPTLDTVLQQLRFCGYRGDFRECISLHLPSQTLLDLRSMDIVDRVAWERANRWGLEQRQISGPKMPAVFYVAPVDARFDPTRLGVLDPDIKDREITPDSLLQLGKIFDPGTFRANLRGLRSWHEELRLTSQDRSSWHLYQDLDSAHLAALLASWRCDRDEAGRVAAVADLLDPALGELGLHHLPVALWMNPAIGKWWRDPERVPAELDQISVTRSVLAGSAGSSIGRWRDAYQNSSKLPLAERPVIRVQHIGDGQRSLRSALGYDALTVIVEPILGLTRSRDRTAAVAAGIGLAILAPEGIRLRSMGHA